MAKKNSKKSISLTLRNYFITGVVVLIPIGFTLYLSKILIGISSNLIPANINPNSYLPFNVPGVEILISTGVWWRSLPSLADRSQSKTGY